ncbi:MAG: fused MFS/spermidine synthase [Planctomycetes bacterium]|nr:fused MFS/spermidine synthase [Planctomycetota bacterium]
MNVKQTPSLLSSPSARRRFLPLLAVLFIGSGGSALIYEIVWLQSLQLVIGSSAVSLAVLLGTFMGGMCAGSLVLPRVVSPRRHPLRVYAAIELGIGLAGVALLFGMPYVDQLYAAHARPGPTSVFLRAGICALCLLPPTLLMGATLPAIARWVEATPRGIAWLGLFYGGNIAGAVFGCLLAGFYLLRVHDGAVATYVAATINLTVAALALLLAARTTHAHAAQPPPAVFTPESEQTTSDPAAHDSAALYPPSSVLRPHASATWVIYVVTALSGLTALGAEVVWTRILSLLLGGTVYTFSIILAVFLVGLGLGSSVGSVLARHNARPRAALAGCQLLLMGAIAWAAYALMESLPYWPIDPSLSRSPWIGFQLDLMRCIWAVLPGAILWGASFPLALASVGRVPVSLRRASVPARLTERSTPCEGSGSGAGYARDEVVRGRTTYEEPTDGIPAHEPGRLVGGVYAANTVGAILGALAFSMVLIPWLGTRGSQRVMIALAGMSVLLLSLAALWTHRATNREQTLEEEGLGSDLIRPPSSAFYPVPWAMLALVPALAVPLAWTVPALPPGLVAYGRYLASRHQVAESLYVGEGRNATVAVTMLEDGVVSFHVCGKVEASTESADMRLQLMLGHLSALLHPKPKSVLVVGCGAGVTAGTFVLHPDVERIVLCEIEPLIPKTAARWFGPENNHVLDDPRVEVVYDDARHYILTTHETFDVITSDPIHPWVRGSAALYTREYFELCRRHLNPGGVVTQWVPLYESSPAVVQSEMATFFTAFPAGTIWSNDISGEGYDVVLLGQAEPAPIDVDALQERLDRPDHLNVVRSLGEVEFTSAMDLLSTYAGQGPDLTAWLQDAQINTDRNLRLQYLAGLGLNAYEGATIYNDLLAHRQFPETLFIATPARRLQLRAALGKPVPSQ